MNVVYECYTISINIVTSTIIFTTTLISEYVVAPSKDKLEKCDLLKMKKDKTNHP